MEKEMEKEIEGRREGIEYKHQIQENKETEKKVIRFMNPKKLTITIGLLSSWMRSSQNFSPQ